MGRRYKNPPIVEAVCEFRFTPDTPWDLAVPGLFYEKVKEEFPQREQRIVQEVELTQGPQGLQQQIRTREIIVLLAEDKKTLVQLGPRLLAVNALKPYPTWQGFKPRIQRAWEALQAILDRMDLQRIGLRYINRVELPTPRVELAEYFGFYPFVGDRLPQTMGSFIMGVEFPYGGEGDRCRVQLLPAPDSSEEKPALMLDIDYFLAQPRAVKVSDVLEWVEKAHNRVEEVFEGCITDRLRELFEEVDEDADHA